MCHCRACDNQIEVKWWIPAGARAPILEDLCNTCLAWADIAMANGPLQEPTQRRKPKENLYDSSDSG